MPPKMGNGAGQSQGKLDFTKIGQKRVMQQKEDMDMFDEEPMQNSNSKPQPRGAKPPGRSRAQKKIAIDSDSDDVEEDEYEASEF